MRPVRRRLSARRASVVRLRHEEGVCLDRDRLLEIYAELGEAAGDRVLQEAMARLAVELTGMQRFAALRETEALERAARTIAEAGAEIGLQSLARVAGDVAAASARGDLPAVAATLARLLRLADRSLCALWDLKSARG